MLRPREYSSCTMLILDRAAANAQWARWNGSHTVQDVLNPASGYKSCQISSHVFEDECFACGPPAATAPSPDMTLTMRDRKAAKVKCAGCSSRARAIDAAWLCPSWNMPIDLASISLILMVPSFVRCRSMTTCKVSWRENMPLPNVTGSNVTDTGDLTPSVGSSSLMAWPSLSDR